MKIKFLNIIFLLFSINLNSINISKVETAIKKSINQELFPGASVSIIYKNEIYYIKSFGNLTYEKFSDKVTNKTLYDLASLTKVICTTSCIIHLYENNFIKLNDKISKYLSEFKNTDKENITIKQLLCHSSGLAADLNKADLEEIFNLHSNEFKHICKNSKRDILWNFIVNKPLEYQPGTKSLYSDFDFIILAKLIEKISNQNLEEYFYNNFTKKMNLKNLIFNPIKKNISLKNIAPTEIDKIYRNKLIHGTVHDEKAHLLNGISGNSGLFGNIEDVTNFMLTILNNGTFNHQNIFNKAAINKFLNYKDNTKIFRLGWKYAIHRVNPKFENKVSDLAYSHLGFTGCSIWVEPKNEICLIVLTNRVYPTRANSTEMIKFREKITKYIYK